MRSRVKYRFYRKVALLLAILELAQSFQPIAMYALTTGPSQPEFKSFEPVGTTDMVDLFSGNFTYNIPLFELPGPDGGYPFNLAYQSDVNMEQEASWVGLGWTLNHGAINRTVQGYPDDFDGDEVTEALDIKDNNTWTYGIASDFEVWSKDFGKNGNKKLSMSLNLSLMHNNHQGWGVGFGTNLSFGKKGSDASGLSGNASLGMNLNSFEGASITPSFSLKQSLDKSNYGFNTSLGINSRDGLTGVSLGASYSLTEVGKDNKTDVVVGAGNTAFYSLARTMYAPNNRMQYITSGFSGDFKLGGFVKVPAFGADASVGFTSSKIMNKAKPNSRKVYGYMYNRKIAGTDTWGMDMGREKEGPLTMTSTNLSIPYSSPDVYSVMGHGAGGSFKPYRSDIGLYTDSYSKSTSGNGSLGFEIDVADVTDYGLNIGGSWSVYVNHAVNFGEGALGTLNFYNTNSSQNASAAPYVNFEPWYFLAAGEMSAEEGTVFNQLGGDSPMKFKLNSGLNYDLPTTRDIAIYKGREATTSSTALNTPYRTTRKPRANVVQSYKVANIFNSVGVEHLAEHQVHYYNYSPTLNVRDRNQLVKLQRTAHPTASMGAMTSLQSNGMRYVYALPAYNTEQEQVQFTVKGKPASQLQLNTARIDIPTTSANTTGIDYKQTNTDEFYSKNTTPSFVHTHLLTSVLGADYVDSDGIPGPSDGDHGYWVKFTYVKTPNYNWRAPYIKANFIMNSRTSENDDKGGFMFGKREQYYLATAETRTHIAVFNLAERLDARGATTALANTKNSTGAAYSYRLTRIDLYAKSEYNNLSIQQPEPIKSVHFDNDNYSLCKGVDNNLYSGSDPNRTGKLTLKKVWFTYRKSNRGQLSPYIFDYHENISAENPNYGLVNVDRWGIYRANTSHLDYLEKPYSFSSYSNVNANNAPWHLKEVQLPSGSKILVDYERDDYAYVQDIAAMEMFKITDVKNGVGSDPSLLPTEKYQSNSTFKVYFQPKNNTIDAQRYIRDLQVVGPGKQVYVKFLSNLLKQSELNYEWVEGYCTVLGAGKDAGTNNYYVTLAPIALGPKNNEKFYHPFAALGWQKLKSDFSGLINKKSSLSDQNSPSSFSKAFTELSVAAGELFRIFKSYYSYCSKNEFSKKIDLNNSFIRLNVPDGKKAGDGFRVKRITLDDKWDEGEDGSASNDGDTYGQVFEYTTKDESGFDISSGVATNEPAIGYEECALKYAKPLFNERKSKTSVNEFFEYPINESYLPGASVGYSKVTVKSLSTFLAQNPSAVQNITAEFAATGESVNQYYTCKDFPILVDETPLESKTYVPKIAFFGIGTLTQNIYTGSQGYSITLNDMHGKPKSVEAYALSTDNSRVATPVSAVEYTYQTIKPLKPVRSVSNKLVTTVLSNDVKVLRNENFLDANADLPTHQLGVHYEVITDARNHFAASGNFNMGINADFTSPVLFGISGFPGFNLSVENTKVIVINKVVHRSGILIKTRAQDGQSIIVTDNLAFDPILGTPLLTSVNNMYGDKVFNYSVPARYAYEGMSAAYQNLGMEFSANLTFSTACNGYVMNGLSSNIGQHLIPGDELIGLNMPASYNDKNRFVYAGLKNGNYLLYDFLNDPMTNMNMTGIKFLIVRSGRRNQLAAPHFAVSALKDPTTQRLVSSEVVNVKVPGTTGFTNSSNVTVPFALADQVISAEAVEYRDDWDISTIPPLDTVGTVYPTTAYLLVMKDDDAFPCSGTATITYKLPCQNVSNTIEWCATNSSMKILPSSPCEFTTSFCDNNNPGSTGVHKYLLHKSAFDFDINDVQIFGCPTNNTNVCVIKQVVTNAACLPSNLENTCDAYPLGIYPCPLAGTPVVNNDGYRFGDRGVWRPYKTNKYLTNDVAGNNQNAANDQNLRTDGAYNAMPLYQAKNPFFAKTVKGKNWRWTSTVTKYSKTGEEVENKDIIGNYSAALFGKNGNTALAVASNAKHYEIGYNGFEEMTKQTGASSDFVNQNGNLDFSCLAKNLFTTETYDIVEGYTNGATVVIDKEFNSGESLPESILLILTDATGINYRVAAQVSNASSVPNNTNGVYLPYRNSFTMFTLTNVIGECVGPNATLKTGTVLCRYKNSLPSNAGCAGVNVVNEFAHTGLNSLKVNSGTIDFEQKRLRLIAGRKYLISAWVRKNAPNVKSYASSNLKFGVVNNGVNQNFDPQGPIIEGWQRVEGIFTYTPGSLFFRFQTGADGTPAYFDDIRIVPVDGSIQTYVYDPIDFRVKAVLDQNNYATFYKYDEAGNLTIVKKETAKGVHSVQETRSYVKANQ